MKKGIVILIVVGMIGWAVYDFIGSADDESSKENASAHEETKDNPVGLNVGNTAPDFELETLDGEQVKLSDYRGSRVMLNFWATWCPPCRAEMPDMEKFHQNKEIIILAVNLTDTEQNIEQVNNFVSDFNLTFPILLDEDIKVASIYQIQPIPTSYMIDSNGTIQYKAFGALNYDLMVQEFEKMK